LIIQEFREKTPLFQYFKKYISLSKEAEQAISEISSIVTVKKLYKFFQNTIKNGYDPSSSNRYH